MVKFFKKSCDICKVQDVALIKYENRSGIRMVFCDTCKKYAERRSFKVIKQYPVKKSEESVIHRRMGLTKTTNY